MLYTLLIYWWFSIAPAHAEDGLEVYADQVLFYPDRVEAHGNARLLWGAEAVTAQNLILYLDEKQAVVTRGTWTRKGVGQLSFERAELQLALGTGQVYGGTFTAQEEALKVTAESFEWEQQGSLTGKKVRFSACDCEGPDPWSASAKTMKYRPGEHVDFRGGAIRVFDIPLLPAPLGRIPLQRKSGLLLPKVGWGEQGLLLAAPLYLTLGKSADVTLTPELRHLQGARILSEGRYALPHGKGTASLMGGWDFKTQSARGGVSWDHRWAKGAWNTAADVNWVSDDTYFSDYRDQPLERGLPFGEARLTAEYGPFSLATHLIQGVEDTPQEWLSAGVQVPLQTLGGGLLVGGGVRSRLRSLGKPLNDLNFRATRPTRLGPLIVEPQILGFAWNRLEGGDAQDPTQLSVEGRIDVRMPAWHQGTRSHQILEPTLGVSNRFATDQQETMPPWPFQSVSPAGASIQPGLLYRWSGQSHRFFEVQSKLVAHRQGFGFEAGMWLQDGPWSLRARVNTPTTLTRWGPWVHFVTAQVSRDDGILKLQAGFMMVPAELLWQNSAPVPLQIAHSAIGWTLPLVKRTLRIQAAGAYNLEAAQWFDRNVSFTYTHPTRCLTLGVLGRLTADRTQPQISLILDIQPGIRKKSR